MRFSKSVLNIVAVCSLIGAGATESEAANQAITGQVVLKTKSGSVLEDASKVVVFLEGVKGDFAPSKDVPTMASLNKEFTPEVVPVLKGQTVNFPNGDKIYHNAFSLSKTKPFDLGLFKKGEDVKANVTFDKPGLVKVYCNIHEKMVGYVLVLDNPYFAMTDKSGKFKIPDVPPGQYKITAWQRYGEPIKKDVTVTETGELKVDLQLTKTGEVEVELFQEQQSQKHLNKWGQPYKAKY